jgi:hypothetical protein
VSKHMWDLINLGIIVGLFGLTLGLVRVFDRL